MPCIPRRHDAVEEIYASVYGFEDVHRCADAHQITGTVGGSERLYRLDDLVHRLGRLAHGKTAYGVAVELQLGYLFHMVDPQIGKGGSLIDTEEHLIGIYRILQSVQPVHLRLAAVQPVGGAAYRRLGVFVCSRVFDALVERHRDSGAEIRLDLHTLLGTHEDAPAVDV